MKYILLLFYTMNSLSIFILQAFDVALTNYSASYFPGKWPLTEKYPYTEHYGTNKTSPPVYKVLNLEEKRHYFEGRISGLTLLFFCGLDRRSHWWRHQRRDLCRTTPEKLLGTTSPLTDDNEKYALYIFPHISNIFIIENINLSAQLHSDS